MQHPPLTKRQKQILDFINLSIKQNGYAPSLEEIKQHFKLKAISTVHEHLENLKSKGLIQKGMNQARGIQISDDYDSNSIIIPIDSVIGQSEKKKDKINENFRIAGSNLKAYKINDQAYTKHNINDKDVILVDTDTPIQHSDLVVTKTDKILQIEKYSANQDNCVGKVVYIVRSL